MKTLTLIAIALLASGASHAGGNAHWGYSGAEGPEYWGKLSKGPNLPPPLRRRPYGSHA